MSKPVWISCKDYDRLKRGEEIELIIEAKGRPAMSIWASNISNGPSSTDYSDYSGYENAVFNGEVN